MLVKNIKKDIKSVSKKLKLPEVDFIVEHPTDENYGDYAVNIAMVLAKKAKQNPLDIAKKLVKHFPDLPEVEKVEVKPPGFINFWLSKDFLLKETKRAVKNKFYGSGDWGKGKRWLIEHTSPNPNKAMHLGHLRNNLTGMAIANILEFLGVDVIRDAIDNNRGIAIAKLMWGYLKFAHKKKKEITDIDYWYEHQDEWLTPEDFGVRPDRFVDELYVKASEDFKQSKETEEKVKQLVVDWENENKKNHALWKKVLDYSYKGQKMTLKRLGNKWDKVWHEHDHYKMGKDIVMQGLKRNIFRKLGDGAILSNLKKYGLTDTVLIKSDGTALYITQDLALTKLKRNTFHPDKLFWVIGPEQSLALKQLFAICEQLGIGKYNDYMHIAYGYISIKGKGKMSSRLGTVLYIDDLLDTAKKKILNKIDKERFKTNEIDDVVEKIAVGAVKYSVLKVRRMAAIAFDFEESLSFEGNSGPYLQYTYARCKSVLKKAKCKYNLTAVKNKRTFLELKDEELALLEELAVLRTLYKFPEIVYKAGKTFSPNLICSFLFDLAQKYNLFYQKVSILQAKSPELKLERLLLTQATAQVIKNGLNLLGIEVLERM